MKKILITGINGFVGSHLAEYVLNNNLGEVHGSYRKNEDLSNIKGIINQIELIECDITDSYGVDKTIKEIKPEYIFHLAAQAFVPSSWKSPIETMNTNIIGSLNLFEAIKNNNKDITIQIAGSSEEYGLVKENEVPMTELNPLRPLSPYGVSKVAMDLLGYQYYQSYGLKIVRTRAFNHEGPRRGEQYVTSNFAKQVALIEAGKQKPILMVGNLEAKRDYTDVRDMVKAYWLAAEKGVPGEVYNIASGKAYKIQVIVDILKKLTKKDFEVKQDPKRLRPSDVQILLGDSTKFRKQTGWKPEIPFEKTMEDLLNYWREKIKE
ncbi:MAG: GDP-mannose 4,6-dehydratase [Candidatus Diapherotrites archaeon CG10_big_fil_rev_8_21_14_0_10_31_34]|nr:MAG: GDP-mannose 4,6-dehydratase [Candidatus Diapherotrites archaeon CG10_big_fil_rev_8_21_14_0_10_31_34]